MQKLFWTMYKFLVELVNFCFHRSPQTIRAMISSSTQSFYWYWRHCLNQRIFVYLSKIHLLQLWPQTVVQLNQILNSRRPIVCSYETRNIAFKPLLGGAMRAGAKPCWSQSKRVFLNWFTIPSKTSCWHTFVPVLFFVFSQRWSGVPPWEVTRHQTIIAAGWWPRWTLGITVFATLKVFAY